MGSRPRAHCRCGGREFRAPFGYRNASRRSPNERNRQRPFVLADHERRLPLTVRLDLVRGVICCDELGAVCASATASPELNNFSPCVPRMARSRRLIVRLDGLDQRIDTRFRETNVFCPKLPAVAAGATTMSVSAQSVRRNKLRPPRMTRTRAHRRLRPRPTLKIECAFTVRRPSAIQTSPENFRRSRAEPRLSAPAARAAVC